MPQTMQVGFALYSDLRHCVDIFVHIIVVRIFLSLTDGATLQIRFVTQIKGTFMFCIIQYYFERDKIFMICLIYSYICLHFRLSKLDQYRKNDRNYLVADIEFIYGYIKFHTSKSADTGGPIDGHYIINTNYIAWKVLDDQMRFAIVQLPKILDQLFSIN